jgi:hypothetical protein
MTALMLAPVPEQDQINLIRSCSGHLLFERVIHVSGGSASDDHAPTKAGG